MEEQQSFENNDGKIQKWIQDNLRIIISIAAVLVIAGGIYSYSKRTEIALDNGLQNQIAQEKIEEGLISEEAAENNTTGSIERNQPVSVSQETENSFIESAIKGDGMTHLARRALANYLEKTPDSTLTSEQKIYIEDYLRKQVGKKSVKIGTTAEFSKSTIQEAIAKSKNLTENQLQNLHQ